VASHAALRRVVLGLRIDPGTNGLAVHVSRLRAELDRDGTPMLATDKGNGYRLVVPEE
jgi:DNA-binding response OmpR family regulator